MKPRMRWMRYLAVGVLLYLLFLLALFPAAQAYRWVAEPLTSALPDLKLGGVEGTVWSGKSRMVYRRILQGQASWQLSPWSLLFGKASLTGLLQAQEGYLQARVAAPLAGGAVELTALEGRLPVSELARLAPPIPVILGGMVSMELPVLVIDEAGRILTAEGSLVWHQAAMSAPQALEFGDLQLVLRTGEEGRIVGDISDRGGPLKLAATVQLAADGGYRVNGTVATAPNAPATLVQSLGLLGKPDAQGRYRLAYSGRVTSR